jgi:diguanylate cyclase (GGDEF)-like protein
VKAETRASDPHSAEEARLRALYELEILDTPPEEAFDRITRLARSALHAPMATISLVDRDRQWFKSRQGFAIDETPRNYSFTTHTIAQQSPLIVPDALLDDRFKTSPLVVIGPKVRTYIGVPLRTAGGFSVGALNVYDVVPREITRDEVEFLQDLGQLVVDEMELRRIALVDQVTGLMTARRFRDVAQRKIAEARTAGRDVIAIVTNLDRFRAFNNSYGHGTGDIVLSAAAKACSALVSSGGLIARLANDKFVVLQFETRPELAALRAQEYQSAIELAVAELGYAMTASAGAACLRSEDIGVDDLIDRARLSVRIGNDDREDAIDEPSGSRLVA